MLSKSKGGKPWIGVEKIARSIPRVCGYHVQSTDMRTSKAKCRVDSDVTCP